MILGSRESGLLTNIVSKLLENNFKQVPSIIVVVVHLFLSETSSIKLIFLSLFLGRCCFPPAKGRSATQVVLHAALRLIVDREDTMVDATRHTIESMGIRRVVTL